MVTSGAPGYLYASLDDDPASHAVLRTLMAAHPDFVDAGRYLTAQDALHGLDQRRVDLLFLDGEMPGGTGLDFLRGCPDRPLSVLVTAHARFAVEAFELAVRDYLLKPVSPERLALSLGRLRPLLAARSSASGKLAFSDGRRFAFFSPEEILAIDGEGNFSSIVTRKGAALVSESLKSVESRLLLFGFRRIHRSHLVPLAGVRRWLGEEVLLDGDLRRPVGRAYRDGLRAALLPPA
jgi:DNA-binding LytR/AlgR family response regulator